MTQLPIVSSTGTMRDAMRSIQQDGRGIAMVVDRACRLSAVVTDGDVRRAVLAGSDLDRPLLDRAGRIPVVAFSTEESGELAALMRQNGVRQLPVIDNAGHPTGLVTAEDLMGRDALPVQAVIMAGGKGTRLRPLTDDCPKPMLPVQGRPLLEHTIDRLRDAGIAHVAIATHYLSDVIEDYFGDGEGHGVTIRYMREREPLGTAGALAGMHLTETTLVQNADLVTKIDYRAMLEFHRKQGAEMTIAVRRHETQIPFGVIRTDGFRVLNWEEKPTEGHNIYCGICLIEPSVTTVLKAGERCDMNELTWLLLSQGRRVAAYPLIEEWMDVGSHAEYARVNGEGK